MRNVRIALVQIVTHPALTIGGRDYYSEPFMASGSPLISHLATAMNVASIRDLCRNEYENFNTWRVASSLDWISKQWELARPAEEDPDLQPLNIVAFPEGSLSNRLLTKLVVPFVEFAAKKGHKVVVLAGTHSFLDSREDLEAYPDRLNHSPYDPFLPKPNTKQETSDERKTRFNRSEELKRISKAKGYDAKSVLPIVHHDGTVSLRIKESPSPFERTNISIQHNSEKDPPGWFNTETEGKGLRVLPLVCSEALQLPNNSRNVDVIGILSHHKRHADFDWFTHIPKMNGKLVFMVNDGAYGGSGVFLPSDSRAENWWFDEPNMGKLPKGDGIIMVNVDLDCMTPELGKFNPKFPNGLFKIAAIVPSDTRFVERQVTDIFSGIEERRRDNSTVMQSEFAGEDYDSILAQIMPFMDHRQVGQIQRTKLWRIRELAQLHNLPEERASVWWSDCKILLNEKPSFLSKECVLPDSTAKNLQDLESKLSWEVIQFLEHETSIANEKGMLHDAQKLVDIKRELEQRRGRVSASSPLSNYFRTVEKFQKESEDHAHSRLVTELGKIVERYNATSGWLNLVEALGDEGTFFFPIAAYNAPEIEIYRNANDKESGVVGHVIREKRPYVGQDVRAGEHRDIYIEDVRSTRSILAVPIFEGNDLIGVLNLESNRKHSFGSIDAKLVAVEAKRLVLDLITMQNAREKSGSNYWHPFVHSWHVSSQLDRVCKSIAKSLPTLHGSPSVGCSIWGLDEAKGLVSISGTARFDFEYANERHLQVKESFVGQSMIAYARKHRLKLACDCGDDTVDDLSFFNDHQLIRDLPMFSRPRKSNRMELRSLASFPFKVETKKRPLIFALTIYGFEHEWGVRGVSIQQTFNQATCKLIVDQLSHLISKLIQSKDRFIRARLESRLANSVAAIRQPFEVIKQVTQEVIDTPGCSIFIRSKLNEDPHVISQEDRKGQLVLVATTGVVPGQSSSPALPNNYPLFTPRNTSVEYEDAASEICSHEYYVGLTNFLGMSKEYILRKNDILDLFEAVLPFDKNMNPADTKCFAPRNTLLEAFAPGASEQMRFLGFSVSSQGNVHGVIRLTRLGEDTPFSPVDEIHCAAIADSCRHFFEDGMELAKIDFNGLSLTSSIPDAERNPFARLGLAISKNFGSDYHDAISSAATSLAAFVKVAASDEELKLDLLVSSTKAAKSESLDVKVDKSQWDSLLKLAYEWLSLWRNEASTTNLASISKRLLVSPCSSGVSTGVTATLQDLNSIVFQHLVKTPSSSNDPVVMSSLRYLMKVDGGRSDLLVPVKVMPNWNSQKPTEEMDIGLVRARYEPANAWHSLDEGRPLSYSVLDRNTFLQHCHVLHRLQRFVKSGLCFPFQVDLKNEVNGVETQVSMVLGIDFAAPNDELPTGILGEKILPTVKAASERIIEIISGGRSSNSEAEISARHDRWAGSSFRKIQNVDPQLESRLPKMMEYEWWEEN